ncbi:MAG: M20/M25/M40 family metallo-hydrolase, partial [Clostridia bacterium]|nr:M20/M25/M40 family metallo-hydrolase [Clostridia bacterium]
MIVLYVALALLALLIALLLIRAATFKPEKSSAKDNSTMETDGELYAKRFSEFIKVKTLSIDDPQNTDAPEHERFIALIQEMYPTVFSKCEFKRVAKYGLVLKFKGKSQDNPSCIMSHYDVVPVTEEMWTKDPFGGEISDGCVWGRGALDNKATLFCSMEAMEHTLKENPDFLPNDDIYFTFGGDEEIGGICQQEIVKEFEKE